MAKIKITNERPSMPKGMKWQNAYRRGCGKAPGYEYLVRYARGTYDREIDQ